MHGPSYGTVYFNELDEAVTSSWDDSVGESFLQKVKKLTRSLGSAQDDFLKNAKKLDSLSGEEKVYESHEFEFEKKYKV